MRSRIVAAGALAPTLLALTTCNACSNAPAISNDASTEAGFGDAGADRVQARDSGEAADVDLGEAGVGWRFLTEMPGCDVQVPLDPKASMMKLTWVACPSASPGCKRLDTTGWRADMLPHVIERPLVSGDNRWLAFSRPLSGGLTFEQDLYDRTTFAPVNAWRVGGFGTVCDVFPVLGPTTLTLVGQFRSDMRTFYASGAPVSSALNPTFLSLQPTTTTLQVGRATSDGLLALTLNYGVGALSAKLGSTSYVTASGAKIFDPVVVGNDVFVRQEYGANGWDRELRVNPDGTFTPFREVQGRHVDHFSSDGARFFWVEAYGDSNFKNFDQPQAEVWWAPITNDPSTLAATAQKLAQVDGIRADDTQVAFDGYFAVVNSFYPPQTANAFVVRALDGAAQKVDVATLFGMGLANDKVVMSQPAFVSKDELWGIVAGSSGQFAFAKLQLGSWP